MYVCMMMTFGNQPTFKYEKQKQQHCIFLIYTYSLYIISYIHIHTTTKYLNKKQQTYKYYKYRQLTVEMEKSNNKNQPYSI